MITLPQVLRSENSTTSLIFYLDKNLHSGKLTSWVENGPLKDEFPIENRDIPSSYVSLLEGKASFRTKRSLAPQNPMKNEVSPKHEGNVGSHGFYHSFFFFTTLLVEYTKNLHLKFDGHIFLRCCDESKASTKTQKTLILLMVQKSAPVELIGS